MNIPRRPRRSNALLAFLIAAGLGGLGCKSEGQATAEATASPQATVGAGVEASAMVDAVVEEHDGGSVALSVAADGTFKAAVSGPDAKPIREDLSGSLEWKANDETKTVPLTLDAKTGVLVGAGPKLDAELTEISYSLNMNANANANADVKAGDMKLKPWRGTLHVPIGGTAQLLAGAKAAVEINVPEGKVGPNGGVIQVVGKDRLEIVADEVSGEVRVYVLDPDFKVAVVGDRSVSLGVVAEAPQVIALAAAEGGAYFTGKWAAAVDPLKITIACRSAGATSVALVGLRPGAKIAVGARAPRLKVRVKTGWAASAGVDPDVDLKLKGDAKAIAGAGAKVDVKAPSVKVKIEPPKLALPTVGVSVGAKAGANAGAGAKAGAKAGAGAGARLKFP